MPTGAGQRGDGVMLLIGDISGTFEPFEVTIEDDVD